MDKAKEALTLFIRSLPARCKFSIISFGSNSEPLEINDETLIENNDMNSMLAIQQLQNFTANLRGKDIATPLEMVINMKEFFEDSSQRIFILTDGAC